MNLSFRNILNHPPKCDQKANLWLFLYLLFLHSANSFNVDVNSKVIHEAPSRSCQDGDCMFGFAVAQHREQGQPW